MPSAPPEVPDELKQPAGRASACFYYTMDGWRLEDPEDPGSMWMTFADLKQSDQCVLQPFLDFFNGYVPPAASEYPAGWEFCQEDHEGKNCYPPPGEGDEPELPEEDPEEEEEEIPEEGR